MAALATAVAALVLSLVGVGWQVLNHVLSGPRLKVTIERGALGNIGFAPVPREDWLPSLAAQGFTEQVLAVDVANVGRLATSIRAVGVIQADGIKLYFHSQRSPALPFRMDAHSAETWYLPWDVVCRGVTASLAVAGASAAAMAVRGYVRLPAGKEVMSSPVSIPRLP